MRQLRTSPRLAASVGVLLYALGLIVLPTLHLANHHNDHVHGPVDAAKIDWSRVRDPKTGRVDLDRLAVALGLSDSEHARAHSEQRPHSHGHSHGGERLHGFGSAEHFSLAFLDTADVPVVLSVPVALSAPPIPVAPIEPDARLLFVEAQRAQAPPA